MLRSSFVACTLLILALPAQADRIAPIARPVERALRVPVVVVGKVTAVEKDTVDATLYPRATNKVAHKIAVVKIETRLAGAEDLTHIKVGFVPAAAGLRRGPDNPELKEGQEWLFFLVKHHGGEFHAIPYMTPPVESKADNYKAEVEAVKKMLATVADPAKALKAEKAEDRFNAAVAIVYHLRSAEGAAYGYDSEPLTAEASRPILKALTEGSWKPAPGLERMGGYNAFAMLGLTDKDGWKPPAPDPNGDFFEQTRAAFAKWLDGPGKDYRIKKIVPKKAEK
jgi:hypothetical protein